MKAPCPSTPLILVVCDCSIQLRRSTYAWCRASQFSIEHDKLVRRHAVWRGIEPHRLRSRAPEPSRTEDNMHRNLFRNPKSDLKQPPSSHPKFGLEPDSGV